jgi:hypothetical protein
LEESTGQGKSLIHGGDVTKGCLGKGGGNPPFFFRTKNGKHKFVKRFSVTFICVCWLIGLPVPDFHFAKTLL